MSDPDDELEAAPPVLGSWRNLYLLVLGALAAQIAVYSWLTWWLS
jgi:hypothetical protein